MKGIIFTEFLDFIETEHGYDMVDAILGAVSLPSDGAYTAVGNYDICEMNALCEDFANKIGSSIDDILKSFGRHLFFRYHEIYPLFFQDCSDPFDFLETIENRIHTEVLKLYPDAKLPQLQTQRLGKDYLVLHYRSSRPLGALCLGVIEGCGKHFGIELAVTPHLVPDGLDIEIRKVSADTAPVNNKVVA